MTNCGVSQDLGKRSVDPPGNTTELDVDRIVGGNTVPSQTKYPWMVYLRSSPNQFTCGGSLINDRYVLTASHCIYPDVSITYYVTLGDLDFSTPYETQAIRIPATALVHYHYRFKGNLPTDNDIALLRLLTPVNFAAYPHIRPICLPSGDRPVIGDTVVIAGWGRVKEKGQTSAKMLEATTQVVSSLYCRKNAPAVNYSNFFCARSSRSNICNGDSGGPLMYRNVRGYYQNVGISSSSNCRKSEGSAYAKTASRCKARPVNAPRESLSR
ncbi:unnamed protein product [Darwinula stevensoni]|uniref:Peptidase S1 domain-containing protein n=1 Tax=Darwinula stevensoni TaxID=69355 RepID=A0A7R9AGQ9_9CRUS|nr:unnamed protein product [Darwinula stevensoni]CAG0904119.1 unnamed protein product [Darwinula stevensoni]